VYSAGYKSQGTPKRSAGQKRITARDGNRGGPLLVEDAVHLPQLRRERLLHLVARGRLVAQKPQQLDLPSRGEARGLRGREGSNLCMLQRLECSVQGVGV